MIIILASFPLNSYNPNMQTCPNDGRELQNVSFKGVTVSTCDTCKGMFFDRGALDLAKNSSDEDLRWIDFDLFEEQDGKFSGSQSIKKCPKDHIQMVSLKYKKSSVILDKCETCQGVWLDEGEFEKIMDYLEDIVEQESAKDYGKEVLKKLFEISEGKEGNTSELKDLFVLTKLFEERVIAEHPVLEQIVRAIDISTPAGI